MNGLSRINVELTSRCQKACWCCGRRKIEAKRPGVERPVWGDMDLSMVASIARQVPAKPFVVQFHWNGEPLLYDWLDTALGYFSHCFRALNTNGKLLVKKADQIIGNLDTLTLSVIESDPEADEQLEILKEFLKIKGDRPPFMVYRLLGNVEPRPWKAFAKNRGGIVATRLLHDPLGSFGYEKPVTIPEIGICLDLLHSVAVDRHGHVCHCVRLDADKVRINEAPRSTIGHIDNATLEEIVTGVDTHKATHPRMEYIRKHLLGQRDEVPLCASCEFYGVPTGTGKLTTQEARRDKSAPQRGTVKPGFVKDVRKDARARS